MREGVIMTDVRTSSDDGAGPGFAAYAGGWSRTRLTPILPLDPRLEAVARAIGAFSNMGGGGVQIAQFRIDPDPEVADYFSRNQIGPDFFHHFFDHPDVLEALGMPPHRHALGFRRRPAPDMLEALVDAIRAGGAYRSFRGTEQDARKLAAKFGVAVGERFSTAAGWLSHEPWHPWFQDVAWDRSFFWFDRGTGVATVLLTTDTD